MSSPNTGGSHPGQTYVPADMPDVYYNASTAMLTIIGYGEVAYYDVDIADVNLLTVLSTQVNGTSDTVDVSDLEGGTYTLTCTTPAGRTFTGTFYVPEDE